jgi:outer membrane receptor for ferrienterochelin and colicins
MSSRIILLVFLLLGFYSFSQGEIKGFVLDGTSPVPGAQIRIVECGTYAVTNLRGEFNVEACDHRVTIVITSLGFEKFKDTLHPHGNIFASFSLKQATQRLDEVVVTGNFEAVLRENSAVLVDVTGKEELEAIGATSLADGIGFQSGLRLETNCQNCGFSQVRMNGLDGAYSQILINGKSAFSSVNNIYGLEQIPVELIEKVEIVKGGGSAIYGANAIAGTINVITKDPVNNGFQVNASADAIGLDKLQYALSGTGTYRSKSNRFGLVATLAHRNRLEYDANDDGYSEIPRLRTIGGNLKMFYKTGKRSKLGGEVRIVNEYRRGGDRILMAPHEANIAEQLKSQVYGGELDFVHYTRNKKNKFDIYGFVQKTIMDNYYGGGMDPDGYGTTQDLSWNAGFRYNRKFDSLIIGSGELTAGLEARNSFLRDEKPGYNVVINQDYFLFGGFAEFNWKMHEKFSWISGMRLDYQNITKKLAFMPRVVFLYKPIKGMGIRATYARGFRAPQVFSEDVHAELVSGEIKRVQLATDLKSEFSNSLNLSIVYDFSKEQHFFTVSIDGFYNQIDNPFILEQLVDPGLEGIVLEKRNGARLSVYGVNADFKYAWEKKMVFELGVTYQQSRYANPVQWVPGQFTNSILKTPNVYANYLFAYKPIKPLNLALFGRISGKMSVPHYAGFIPEDIMEVSPAYYDLGFKIDYTFSLPRFYNITVGAYIKNMLNSYQSDFDSGMDRDAGYVHGPTMPRTIGISLKIGNL